MTKWKMTSENVNKKGSDKRDIQHRRKSAERLITQTQTLNREDMEKRTEETYNAKIAREDQLLAAAKEKKLKSKTLIREVKRIQKTRKAKEDKKEKK